MFPNIAEFDLSRTDAGGGVHTFAYDAAGLLVSDRNADALLQTLTAAASATGKQVTVAKGSTETRTYLTESVATGGYRRVTTDAAGLATTTVVGAADNNDDATAGRDGGDVGACGR